MSDKNICIHIFRRDYRLEDNTTLIEACKTHDIVLPIFIFTKKQIDKKLNPYRSDNTVQFLCESLQDLDKQLKEKQSHLTLFYENDKEKEYNILETLITNIKNVKTISFNMDYTHYSKERDNKIKELCKKHTIECLSQDDICLNPVGTILTGSGTPYTKFTPFWNKSALQDIKKIQKNKYTNYYNKNNKSIHINKIITSELNKLTKLILSIDAIMTPDGQIMGSYNKNVPECGGRDCGLKILKNIKEWDDYNEKRDNLIYQTTHLSPFNKYGCVSIREVYWSFKKLGKEGDEGLIRQLFWRDFFYNLSHFHPEIYIEKALNPSYRTIKWKEDKESKEHFQKWCDGKTGYPIVDASMTELNTNGYMHNRGRLIVSNFLCRLLHIDWKLGERYFASKLYDYDPTQNNFGWQVSGSNSSGTTSRPLSQTIMNPWIQSSKHDNDGDYIKKWLPELKNVKSSHLHKWYEYHNDYSLTDKKDSDKHNKQNTDKKETDKKEKITINYIKPIVDYTIEKEKNLKMYKKYL